jgi:hypothetical protein
LTANSHHEHSPSLAVEILKIKRDEILHSETYSSVFRVGVVG